MNRIDQLFSSRKQRLLSVYFCAGNPTLEGTLQVLQALQDRGVDMVEIGIPFSDPMADGPVIQQAAQCALTNGMTLRHLFDQLGDVRRDIHIPLLLMGYLNPILQYGFDNFCRDAQGCGIDGLIIPDLPFEPATDDYRRMAEQYGLHLVSLITPQTDEDRIRLIDRHTRGFLYLVSTAAVTGARSSFDADTQAYFARIAAMKLSNPLLVGFGVGNKETFDAACRYTRGAIVGSKFVQLLQEKKTAGEAVEVLKRITMGNTPE